jgi:hypothetical protein
LITNTIDYLRRNAIALVALVCSLLALAAGSYAAVSLPAGSVGPRQLNHRLIGGYVRAWASVNPVGGPGGVLASSGGARVLSGPPSGSLTIGWPGKFPRSSRACIALATAAGQDAGSPLIAFYEGRGKVVITNGGGPFPSGIGVALVC